jgi:hypothetical protein
MSNPQSVSATVNIYTKSSYASLSPITLTLKPNEVKKQSLALNGPNGSGITDYAYRIRSSVPIVVYQFNPMPLHQIASNDASLLLPTNTLDKEYIVLNYRGGVAPASYPTYSTIVAVEPGVTQVTYTSTVTTNSGSLGSISATKSKTVQLNQFQILNIENSSGESSGSRVVANKKVAVFAGAVCTNIPEGKTYCDHIEEQLFPLQIWGKNYNAVKTRPRDKEYDVWRIIAQKNNTKVTLSSPLNQTFTLNAGEFKEISTTESFQITADNPVMVGQFMVGSQLVYSKADYGDPSYIMNVPYEQYRTSYDFLVPVSYDENYVTVITPKNNEIKLDGTVINQATFKNLGSGEYKYGYLDLGKAEAAHNITAQKPVGLWGYGFAHNVSYGYPIGLDLKRINNTN